MEALDVDIHAHVVNELICTNACLTNMHIKSVCVCVLEINLTGHLSPPVIF